VLGLDQTHSLAGQPAVIDVKRVVAHSKAVQASIEVNRTRVVIRAVRIKLTATKTSPAGYGALVVGLDSEGFESAGHQLRQIMLISLSGIVPLAGLLAWLLSGNALRTVSELTEEAEA